ncbi:hypothetical protein Q8F55_004548 [Vanrija albida]|uniref:Uncharacterized protein n=1 Tax=Vanrija albida TaxID=181172 RepID=A0ABR3Q725_9TREE
MLSRDKRPTLPPHHAARLGPSSTAPGYITTAPRSAGAAIPPFNPSLSHPAFLPVRVHVTAALSAVPPTLPRAPSPPKRTDWENAAKVSPAWEGTLRHCTQASSIHLHPSPHTMSSTSNSEINAKIDAVFDDIEGHLQKIVALRTKSDEQQYDSFMKGAREQLHERQDEQKLAQQAAASGDLSRSDTRLEKDVEELKIKLKAHRDAIKAAAAGK